MRDTAGSAAAPAARCRNCYGGEISWRFFHPSDFVPQTPRSTLTHMRHQLVPNAFRARRKRLRMTKDDMSAVWTRIGSDYILMITILRGDLI